MQAKVKCHTCQQTIDFQECTSKCRVCKQSVHDMCSLNITGMKGRGGESVVCHEKWAWCQACWDCTTPDRQAFHVQKDKERVVKDIAAEAEKKKASKEQPKETAYKIPKKPKCSYCDLHEPGTRKCTYHEGCKNNAHHMCFIDCAAESKIDAFIGEADNQANCYCKECSALHVQQLQQTHQQVGPPSLHYCHDMGMQETE